jgi:hypothetical protein
VAKQRDGKKVRHIYDAAKTPLQRVLLSEGVSPQKQQELSEMAQALDPLRLFQQLERLRASGFSLCSRRFTVIGMRTLTVNPLCIG